MSDNDLMTNNVRMYLERHERLLATLYFRETGYTDTSREENRERYLNWISTRALTAALDRIADLEDAIARYT